ncbi:MAG: hypothetical protein V4660_04855 [Pseudomonadota bacterium]
MTNKLYRLPESCDFSMAQNSSTSSHDCSPQLLDSTINPFVGILINAPEEIIWTKDPVTGEYISGKPRLMVSGVVKLKYSYMGFNGNFSIKTLLVAVNKKTAKSYDGKMIFPDFLPQPKKKFKADIFPITGLSEISLNSPVANYFNIDLIENLGIPIDDATYIVYAILGEFKSNALTIKTKVK